MTVVLDRAYFAHMTGADRALQGEIVVLFRGQAPEWAGLLAPGAPWRDVAHTIKGTARGIGLMALAEACEAAEGADAGRIETALALLRAALGAALAALEQWAADEAQN